VAGGSGARSRTGSDGFDRTSRRGAKISLRVAQLRRDHPSQPVQLPAVSCAPRLTCHPVASSRVIRRRRRSVSPHERLSNNCPALSHEEELRESSSRTSARRRHRHDRLRSTALAAPAGPSAASAPNCVVVASSSKNFSTLVALVKAGGLVKTLSGKGPFTIMAPTNAAFAKLKKTARARSRRSPRTRRCSRRC
jgi:hypothetical protein